MARGVSSDASAETASVRVELSPQHCSRRLLGRLRPSKQWLLRSSARVRRGRAWRCVLPTFTMRTRQRHPRGESLPLRARMHTTELHASCKSRWSRRLGATRFGPSGSSASALCGWKQAPGCSRSDFTAPLMMALLTTQPVAKRKTIRDHNTLGGRRGPPSLRAPRKAEHA